MMASAELECLTDADAENPNEIIDFIAVQGINDRGDGAWLGYDAEGGGSLPTWLQDCPYVRLLIFSYSLENVFVQPGIQAIAAQLLGALSELRVGGMQKRDLIFVCHDVGGIVVKQALTMSKSGHPEFRDIAASTRCILFMGCPHRCRNLSSLQQSFQRLFKHRTSTTGSLSVSLTGSLARLAISIDQSFLDTKLQATIASINISSRHEDEEDRIFDPYETSVSVRSNKDTRRYLQVESESPHGFLGDDGLPSSVASFLPSTVQPQGWVRGHDATLELLISQACPQVMEYTLDSSPSPISPSVKTILSRRPNQAPVYFAVHEPNDVTGTALSIHHHLMHESSEFQVHQFFEFRERDSRRNSVDSMLCTFLADLLSYNTWQDNFSDFRESATNFHAWSLQLLLLTFHDHLLSLSADKSTCGITWVLVNFDERISSYQWLLSNLCEFLRSSEVPLTLVIVNSRPLELEACKDCFEIISLSEDNPDTDQTNDPATTERGEDGNPDNSFPFGVDQEVLELIVEIPDLYPVQARLSRLARDCNMDVELRQLLFEWLRLRAADLSNIDLDQLGNLFPVTASQLFRHLWLPSSASTTLREQIYLAASLLCYPFRPLTVQELSDLEQNTGYGEQIGRREDRYSSDNSPRTLSLLSGVVDVCRNEVQFRHEYFRDFFISQTLVNRDGSVALADDCSRHLHARIAGWCLERIGKATPQEWLQCQTDGEHVNIPESRKASLSYAVKHWLRHAQMARKDVEANLSVQAFLEDPILVQRWTRAYWSLSNPATRGNISSITPLAIFAEHGADSLLYSGMVSYEHLPSFERQTFRALEASARRGNLQMVQRLLTSRLPEDENLDSVLLQSFSSQSSQVAQEVIEQVKQQARKLEDPLTVLGWAAYHGLKDAVKLLIPLVPAERVEKAGCIPMNLALRGARIHATTGLQIITLLVNAQYPLVGTLSGGESFSALNTACRLGNPSVAVFLAKVVFANNSDSGENQERPDDFCSAVKFSLINAHHQTLEGLLDFAFAQGWLDMKWIGKLIEFPPCIKTLQCSKKLSSHLVKIAKRSDDLKEVASSTLYQAFNRGTSVVLPDLLALWGGLKPSEFSHLLDAAIEAGSDGIDTVSFLIEEGLRVCDKETYAQALGTALGGAVYSNDTELALVLLDKAPCADVETPNGRPALYHAAFQGFEKMVNLLLQAKADVNAIGDASGWRPIHAAYDHAKILEALLKGGADVNAKTDSQKTALFYACDWDYPDSVKILLEHGAEVCTYANNATELSLAAASGQEEIACMLLESGADPLEYPSKKLSSPLLHTCVALNLFHLLKMLLLYNFPIDETDEDGYTALNCITSETNTSVLKLLFNRGASLDTSCKTGQTPLSKAIKCSNEEVFRWLVKAGANVNAHIGRQGSILHMACFQGSFEMVKLLCENNAVYRNDPGINGTPLHAALRRPNDQDDKAAIVDYLLCIEDLDLNQSSDWWGGCLNLACLCANMHVVETLLKKAAVNAEDRIGRQPIHFALYRTIDHVKMLLKEEADLRAVDLMKRNALHFAVVSGRLDVVTYVLDQDKNIVHQNDIDGWTPLMWAVRVCTRWDTKANERANIIEKLIDCGVDPRVRSEGLDRRWTAYELACYYGLSEELVKLVEPTKEDLELDEMSFWDAISKGQKKKAREIPDSYCDACLMDNFGLEYSCDVCDGFCLCFKCYRSRNTIHPGHSFTDSGEACEYEDDSSLESSSEQISSRGDDRSSEHEGTETSQEPEDETQLELEV